MLEGQFYTVLDHHGSSIQIQKNLFGLVVWFQRIWHGNMLLVHNSIAKSMEVDLLLWLEEVHSMQQLKFLITPDLKAHGNKVNCSYRIKLSKQVNTFFRNMDYTLALQIKTILHFGGQVKLYRQFSVKPLDLPHRSHMRFWKEWYNN